MSTCASHVTITIDGGKGSGKSSTAQFVAQALADAGIDVRLYEHTNESRTPQPITGAACRSKFVSIVVRQEP